MAYKVEGKIALITGAATGIGFQYASELLRHGLKAVTIVDFDAKKGEDAVHQLNNQYGRKVAIFVKADVTKSDEIKNAFTISMDAWKSLDIVINNAGVMKDSHWEMEIALNCVSNRCALAVHAVEMDHQIDLRNIEILRPFDNYKKRLIIEMIEIVVAGSLLAMEYMGKNKGGKGGVVVNIASILGLQELSGCPVYVGTKHFVLGMTRSFGQPYFYDLTGVKFLTMCPGVTNTPLISDASKYALDNYKGLGTLLAQELGSLPDQKPVNVAKGMYTLITEGENGSVWVCEGGQPIYEVGIPDRRSLRKTN